MELKPMIRCMDRVTTMLEIFYLGNASNTSRLLQFVATVVTVLETVVRGHSSWGRLGL